MWLDMAVIMSDLSVYDKAIIEPSLHFIFDKNNCEKKIEQLASRGNLSWEEAETRVKSSCNIKQCFGKTEDFEYWTCPCRIYDSSISYLVTMALHLKNGILPFEGGYFDQPANVMAALSIVQIFLNEQEERERKKAEKKRRK
jgi:hypothetical protein